MSFPPTVTSHLMPLFAAGEVWSGGVATAGKQKPRNKQEKKPISLFAGKTIAVVHRLPLVIVISEGHEAHKLSC